MCPGGGKRIDLCVLLGLCNRKDNWYDTHNHADYTHQSPWEASSDHFWELFTVKNSFTYMIVQEKCRDSFKKWNDNAKSSDSIYLVPPQLCFNMVFYIIFICFIIICIKCVPIVSCWVSNDKQGILTIVTSCPTLFISAILFGIHISIYLLFLPPTPPSPCCCLSSLFPSSSVHCPLPSQPVSTVSASPGPE